MLAISILFYVQPIAAFAILALIGYLPTPRLAAAAVIVVALKAVCPTCLFYVLGPQVLVAFGERLPWLVMQVERF